MRTAFLVLTLLASQVQAQEWSAYIVMVDFEGDGVPERVTVDPWYDLTEASLDNGRVLIERLDDMGTYTTYTLYGSESDILGLYEHSVHGVRKEKLRLSVGEDECDVFVYWDGVWDTMPYTLRYIGC